MKKYFNQIVSFAFAAVLATGMSSCMSDEPFVNGGDGELKLQMVINSDVTRAQIENEDDLRANCVVYISGTKGLLHKFKGLENVPEAIKLKGGNYVAEAWTGDSVSASFDKKFYRGYEPFVISAGVNQVVVNCKIANVVASVNPETVDSKLVSDLKVTIGNTRASLEFDAANIDTAKGYYMMPNGETSLTYTIEGKNAEGHAFTKTGEIENVQRAHEYRLNFIYHPDSEEIGGSFISVVVDESEVIVDDEIMIFSRPTIQLVGGDITKQLVGAPGEFTDHIIKVSAFGDIKNLVLKAARYTEMNLPVYYSDLMNLTPSAAEELKTLGIHWDIDYVERRDLTLSYVTLSADFLNALPESDEEYVIAVEATDSYGKTNEETLRIAVGEGAIIIEDPVEIDDAPLDNLLAIRSNVATLTGTVTSADALNPGIQYRESGTEEWSFAPAESPSQLARGMRRAAGTTFSVTLRGLKAGTRYEYRACSNDGEFVSASKFFTTETMFTIPNAGFESWVEGDGVRVPDSQYPGNFWDSGNHGSKVASVTLTNSSTDMVHGGTYSARLQSKIVMNLKLAAGNLFTGDFQLDGMDGILTLGRPFDGSHPEALRVYANYRPGTVTNKGGSFFKKDDLDHAQIYVALSTEPYEVRTKSSNQRLFDPDDNTIIGYGEKTFAGENYGPDGALQELVIPISYKNTAKTRKPLYVIIVCAASKYGDYYNGADGSLLYVDDFEFIY